MEIPEKYRGEMYVIIAPEFTHPIDVGVGHATAFGNKPSYVCRIFFDLEDLRRDVGEWIDGEDILGD